MQSDFVERRRHIRVYFDGHEEMRCQFALEGHEEKMLSASVLDISLGGIHLAIEGEHGFVAGDRLVLLQLAHRNGSVCDMQLAMEIRWIFARQEFDRVYLGCQFFNLPDASYLYISTLMDVKIQQTKAGDVQAATAICESSLPPGARVSAGCCLA